MKFNRKSLLIKTTGCDGMYHCTDRYFEENDPKCKECMEDARKGTAQAIKDITDGEI